MTCTWSHLARISGYGEALAVCFPAHGVSSYDRASVGNQYIPRTGPTELSCSALAAPFLGGSKAFKVVREAELIQSLPKEEK